MYTINTHELQIKIERIYIKKEFIIKKNLYYRRMFIKKEFIFKNIVLNKNGGFNYE